jgi:hypothetical protein
MFLNLPGASAAEIDDRLAAPEAHHLGNPDQGIALAG